MTESDNLPKIFSEARNSVRRIENYEFDSQSDTYKNFVEENYQKAEKCVKWINLLELYSSNETLSELSTESMKYLITPALLGYFMRLRSAPSGTQFDQSIKRLEMTKIFYLDFVNLCQIYEIPNVLKFFPNKTNAENDESNKKDDNKNIKKNMAALNQPVNREEKIERYKLSQNLKRQIEELEKYIERENVDDEVKRKYYLSEIQSWAVYTSEELNSIDMELGILKSRQTAAKESPEASSKSATKPDTFANKNATSQHSSSSVKPFIIVRSAQQAAVFGAGYSSLPTYTVEEFAQMQIDQGLLPAAPPTKQQKPIMFGGGDAAEQEECESNSRARVKRVDPTEQLEAEEEAENAKRDLDEERDDPTALQEARKMDAFKDDNRRGSGNTYNRC